MKLGYLKSARADSPDPVHLFKVKSHIAGNECADRYQEKQHDVIHAGKGMPSPGIQCTKLVAVLIKMRLPPKELTP